MTHGGWTGPGAAPEPLERLRLLLNSDDRFNGIDRLDGADGVAEVVRVVGVARDRPARSTLADARDALRGLITGSVDPDALAAVAARHPLSLGVEPDGSTRLVGEGTVEALLGIAHDASRSGDLARLKACANPDCGWIYWDGSRNRSGRWCSMDECGDVMKARAYRTRRKEEEAS